jgi:hypothetical protein
LGCVEKKKVVLMVLLVIGVFALRLWYGLNLCFGGEDERAIYLLGLEWASFDKWPLFGADIVHTQQQIPGALQSLLVGIGFSLLRIPEAPFVVVNLLSLGAIWLWADYMSRRISVLSFPWIFLFLASLPWTLEISTHVYNPSYLLLPAVLFFIGFFETMPGFTLGIWKPRTAFFWFGVSLGAIFQLHMSWPLLLPLVVWSLWVQRRAGVVSLGLWGALGFLIPFSLVIPTFLHYGWREILAIGGNNTGWNGENVGAFFPNLIRLLCYGTYEMFLFLGETAKERWETLRQGWYLVPFFGVLALVGAMHLLYFVYVGGQALRKGSHFSQWSFGLFTFLFLESYGIFLISLRPPVSRNFYLLIPVSLFISLLTLQFFGSTAKRVRWIQALICISVLYHGLLGYNRFTNFSAHHSLYHNRGVLVKVLKEKSPYEYEQPRYKQFH